MSPPSRRDRIAGAALVAVLAGLVAVGLWQTSGLRGTGRVAVTTQCPGLMGTSGALAAVVAPGDRKRADRLLGDAENSLRNDEALLSDWIADSEISRLNAAVAGDEVPLSPATLEVLRAARDAYSATGGAFDATCRPLVELWREAARRGRPPTEAEIAQARAASSWDAIELTPSGARKNKSTARVDLGGIAKGYAIDRAAAALRAGGIPGGMVDVGGDVVCFGSPPQEPLWPVSVQNPFGSGSVATLRLAGGAVCTSGNYERFFEVAGKRYSHIIDPRTGRPAENVASATVIAPDCLRADVWATALSVLGAEGLRRLPEDCEALLVVGTAESYRILGTPGMRALVQGPLPWRWDEEPP
jgi:FAD:protein FMN transferase